MTVCALKTSTHFIRTFGKSGKFQSIKRQQCCFLIIDISSWLPDTNTIEFLFAQNQKQYLNNIVKKLSVDLLHSYLQLQGIKKSQLSEKDQEEVVKSLGGKEDFKAIKNMFRKLLSQFSGTIGRIIQDKKNLPEETLAELKRNQLRATICGAANRCFTPDRMQDIFPNYTNQFKVYSLETFGNWIEGMTIEELDYEIVSIPKHFFKEK